LVVKVLNTAGAAMLNVPVAFRVIRGGGKIIGANNCSNTECVITTAMNGTAAAQWQLGKIDSQKVEARVVDRPELTVQFTAKIDLTGLSADDQTLPTELTLQQRPNPFHDFTQFEITLPHSGQASLKIFDMQGREVVTLFDEIRPAGRFSLHWTGNDQANQRIASGAYFAILQYRTAATAEKIFIEKKQLLYLK
jgi:hypothetical protein